MLCYQSSRSAADVLRDTFGLLVINRRAWVKVCGPIVVLAFVVTCVFGGTVPIKILVSENMIQRLGQVVLQFEHYSSAIRVMLYGVMGLVSGLLVAPMLQRYFVDCLEVKRITWGQWSQALVAHKYHALIAALATGAFAAAYVCVNWFYAICLLVVYALAVPNLLVGTKRLTVRDLMARKPLASLAWVALMAMIVNAMPYLAFDIIGVAIHFLSKLMPLEVTDRLFDPQVLEPFIAWLGVVSFCSAAIVLLVGSVLVHGTFAGRTAK